MLELIASIAFILYFQNTQPEKIYFCLAAGWMIDIVKNNIVSHERSHLRYRAELRF